MPTRWTLEQESGGHLTTLSKYCDLEYVAGKGFVARSVSSFQILAAKMRVE
jgi:hypothetical protein